MTKISKGLLVGVMSSMLLSACGGTASMNPFVEEIVKETTSSTDQFHYQADKVEVGTVYHFQVSNRDRTYAKKIALRVSDINKIDSFKIYQGSNHTVVVSAEIDWSNFSSKRMSQVEIQKDLSRKETLELHMLEGSDNTYVYGGERIPTGQYSTGHFPATNHGFDFSDLNFVFRHLKEPKSNVDVGVLAPVPPGKLAYTGKMQLTYEGEEMYNNHECYRYSLSGRGISEKEGYLLVNKDSGYFEYMELDANYNPRFDYFRYELSAVTKMNPAEWESYVNEETTRHFSQNPQ
jgi:hypothetical protein